MPPTILVIESSFDLADVIQSVLVAHDYACDAVQHSAFASVLTDTRTISLVICGLDLLIRDELFLQQFRTFVGAQSASVIYTIGGHIPEGIPDVQILQMPFSVDTLIAKVQMHLNAVPLPRHHDNASHILEMGSSFPRKCP